MQFSTVNDQALVDAATAVVGPEATKAILQLYQLIDKAMHGGYQLGKLDAERNVDAALNATFDNGYQLGEAEAKAAASFEIEEAQGRSWDDGYLQGVDDARSRPAVADELVMDILSDAADEAYARALDEYAAELVQDSGDETTPPQISALG